MRTVLELALYLKTFEWLNRAHGQYIKYLFYGGVNTILTFIIYCIGIELSLSYRVANSIAWTVGLIVSFIFHGRFIFESTYRHKQFLLFIGSNLLNLIISMTMLSIQINIFYMNAILASLITIPCVVTINFLNSKYVVFKPNF